MLQRSLTKDKVHGVTVIWIGQPELPQFVSLINVRNSGDGELEQGLRKTVQHAEVCDGALKCQESVHELLRLQDGLDKVADRRFIGFVVSCPACSFFCLAHGLKHVIANAVEKVWRGTSVGTLIGPHPYQCLVEQILVVRIRRLRSPDDGFLLPIELAPNSQLMVPGKRNFGKHVDSCPQIFGSFRVMRRGSEHLVWPNPGARLNLSVEFLRRNAEM